MSWEQLSDIYREARELKELELSEPPTACPNDGTPLEEGPRGQLHCRFDGYRWPEDSRR